MINSTNFPGRGRVAILRTRPETVLDDYNRLMHLAAYEQNLPRDHETILKINLAWHIWYPSASTTPWQLDGVVRTLLRDGYLREGLVAATSETAGVDAEQGLLNNRHKLVLEHFGIKSLNADEASMQWLEYKPTRPLAVLDKIYPDGVFIPKSHVGKNMLNLPTIKTDASTMLNGAMKNIFGGLLDEKRHWTRPNLHDTLVDLLQISQDIYSGMFCVMDGTFAGEGPGPRALRPFVKNTILAGSDPVALDAVAANMVGIDPMRIRYIRHAHERGLGVGEPREIQIVGDAHIAQENWHFEHEQDTLASWGQKQLDHGALKPLDDPLLHSPLAPIGNIASSIYNNLYWYPFVGAKRAEMMLNTAWGQKFLQYSEGLPFNPGANDTKPFTLLAAASIASLAALGIGAYLNSRRGDDFSQD